MKKILGTIFLSLSVCSFASADLKGISRVNILVEDISSKGVLCGVTKKKIETSARYILSNSKIEIIDKPKIGTPTLYIQATVSENSSLCYSNTRLEVYEYIKHPNSGNYGDFVYFNSSGIQSNSKSNFASFFFEELENRFKRFVVEHNKENK